MKKLIAISVMSAFIAGAAFADVTVGGYLDVGGQLMNGSSKKNSKPGAGAVQRGGESQVKLTIGNNDAGGWLTVRPNSFHHWFGWWRPIPQLRLQIGSNPDGDFGSAQISGWGFTGEAKNIVAMGEYSGEIPTGLGFVRATGWYPGTGGTANIQAQIFPVQGLQINIWLPFTSDNAKAAGFVYSRFEAQIIYTITDIGKIFFAYKSDTGYQYPDPDRWWVEEQKGTPKLFASFYLDQAIENMAIDFGLAYKFPLSYKVTQPNARLNEFLKDRFGEEAAANYIFTQKVTVQEVNPIELGLGYRLTMGNFTFKARASLEAGGYKKTSGSSKVDGMSRFGFSILPNYTMGPVTIYFFSGVGLDIIKDWWTKKDEGGKYVAEDKFVYNKSNVVAGWYVNPYILMRAGDLRFMAGVKLYSNCEYSGRGDPPIINWAIPVGFYTYF